MAFSKEEELSTVRLDGLRAKPCTFVHVWALWCDVCVEEMPKLVEFLNKQKKINPILVDVTPEASRKKSIETMRKFKPLFPVYLKPYGNDEQYMKAIDGEWGGGLPYSALYHQGKKVKIWNGASPLQELKEAIDKTCK